MKGRETTRTAIIIEKEEENAYVKSSNDIYDININKMIDTYCNYIKAEIVNTI